MSLMRSVLNLAGGHAGLFLLVALWLLLPSGARAQGSPELVRDISPGAGEPVIKHVVDADGTVFLVALSRLWRSDGTLNGTFEVRSDMIPHESTLRRYRPASLHGVLIFGGSGPLGGLEPWRSDGTPGGTYLLADVTPVGSTYPADFTRLGEYVYFRTSTQYGALPQIWRTDGTRAGTQLVREFSLSEGAPLNLTSVGNSLFFETLVSNGTTYLWRLSAPGANPEILRSFLGAGTLFGGRGPGDHMLGVGNTLYFSRRTAAEGTELWKSDGSTAGTMLVRDIEPGSYGSSPSHLVEVNGRVAFLAAAQGGLRVYTSDGTEANTVDAAPSVLATPNNVLVSHGDYLLFRGQSASEAGVFRASPPSVGATLIATTYSLFDGTAVGALTYFSGNTPGRLGELWRTDGTPGGTSLVADQWLMIPADMAASGGALFFAASDGIIGRELWRVGLPTRTPTPLAADDGYGTGLNAVLTVSAPGVLANDTSNGGGPMTAELVATTSAGTLTLGPDGGFTYTPPNGFSGSVSFTYRAVNPTGAGNVATVTISVAASPLPTTVADAFGTGVNTLLNVPAPGVLANDSSNGGGALTAELITTTTQGTLTLGANGGFTYAPTAGFAGTDTFTYRAVSTVGPGNTATATITVAAGPLPPTALYAASILGNTVTLRWTPPAGGLAPTDYVIEGGATPGQAMASLVVGGTTPIYTFPAPTGAFYVRVHTLSGANRSVASNEIRIFVSVPAAPSAPADLVGLVNGSSIALAWRNTFAGGAPGGIVLDVSDALNTSLPLGLTDSFQFGGVPGGTYTLSLRAINGAGSSPSSNAITLTFPSPCTGAPLPPSNFLAYHVGSTLFVVWDPATSGPAPTSYVLNVTGAFGGSFATPGRTLSGAVGPGTYNLSVSAANACGSSAATPVQTVVVP